MSSMRFMPKVYEELASDVTIISARARYERLLPN
jgi:hypothetical protein